LPQRWVGGPAEGIVTVTDRPPSSRGQAVTVPPWSAAMDATMARPSPKPSWDVRSLSRWNGWKMRSTSAGLMTGPALATLNGTVSRNKITFGTVGSFAVTYSGTFSGNSMSGTYNVTGSPAGNWSATKA
jgi:hypothetical protein